MGENKKIVANYVCLHKKKLFAKLYAMHKIVERKLSNFISET